MGRGRAKAKQTKVARDLKYRSHETDFGALARELHGEPESKDGEVDPVDAAGSDDSADRDDNDDNDDDDSGDTDDTDDEWAEGRSHG